MLKSETTQSIRAPWLHFSLTYVTYVHVHVYYFLKYHVIFENFSEGITVFVVQLFIRNLNVIWRLEKKLWQKSTYFLNDPRILTANKHKKRMIQLPNYVTFWLDIHVVSDSILLNWMTPFKNQCLLFPQWWRILTRVLKFNCC